jgi:hypothetical protein
MRQVGHSDSKMTTDVYAKLQQRVQREHGAAFDRLVRTARERRYGADPEDEKTIETRRLAEAAASTIRRGSHDTKPGDR